MKKRMWLVCPFVIILLLAGCREKEFILSENPKKEIGQNVMELSFDDLSKVFNIRKPILKN